MSVAKTGHSNYFVSEDLFIGRRKSGVSMCVPAGGGPKGLRLSGPLVTPHSAVEAPHQGKEDPVPPLSPWDGAT